MRATRRSVPIRAASAGARASRSSPAPSSAANPSRGSRVIRDVRRAIIAVVVMAARAASADDFVGSLRFSGRREVAREPELWLDPVLRTHFEGLVQDTERHESEFVVGDT